MVVATRRGEGLGLGSVFVFAASSRGHSPIDVLWRLVLGLGFEL